MKAPKGQADRHPCLCSCGCRGTSATLGDPCPLCNLGGHSPAPPVRAHLAAGQSAWERIVRQMPGEGPGSFLRRAQAWRLWHDRQACPVPPSLAVLAEASIRETATAAAAGEEGPAGPSGRP